MILKNGYVTDRVKAGFDTRRTEGLETLTKGQQLTLSKEKSWKAGLAEGIQICVFIWAGSVVGMMCMYQYEQGAS